MTNIGILENKISTVKKYLKILERYGGLSEKEIVSSLDVKGAVERYLYLVAQATIDVAEVVISYKKLRKPMSFSESFEILREGGFISGGLCTRLIQMTGFRNVLAHGYEKVDYGVLIHTLGKGRKDIEEFLQEIEKLVI